VKRENIFDLLSMTDQTRLKTATTSGRFLIYIVILLTPLGAFLHIRLGGLDINSIRRFYTHPNWRHDY
jgi:hypothetical protein